MRKLDVGVVGCGTAGPAAALFLARQGHDVTVYERVENPSPVGAGIILQPTGQHVLRKLGLLGPVEARGARLTGLTVEYAPDKVLLDLTYADADDESHGIGLHRGVLFEALFRAVRHEPRVTMRLGVAAEALVRTRGGKFFVEEASGARHGPHDLVVAADGAKSRMRDDTGLARAVEPYPWGALWFVARDPDRRFEGRLFQRVDGTKRMIGILPTGLGPTGKTPLVSLFWSIAARDVPAWRDSGFDAWKSELAELVPQAACLYDQIRGPEDVLFSSYHDVVMRSWNTNAVVHLGDAAHAMSPQLGQGANLALWDAMVLADCIAEERSSLVCALDRYTRTRRDHLGYYQWVTRGLTPFFQSDHEALGWLRDFAMPIAGRFAVFRKAMVMGMCGVADGHPWKSVFGSSRRGA